MKSVLEAPTPAPAPETEILKQAAENSITFLNMSGDITITWDSADSERREEILKLIRAKMSDGYVFFTLARVPLTDKIKKTRITKKNLNQIDQVIIPDAEFERILAGVNDREVAMAVTSGAAEFTRRQGHADLHMQSLRRAQTAEEVESSQSVAVRPLAGG